MEQGRSKIMVVDDEEVVRDVIGSTLELFGHDVVMHDRGRKALDAVDHTIDVIILDINMPEMDGFETLAELNTLHLDIPVLFLTGNGNMEKVVKALNLGAYDFLTKPVGDLDIFNAKIKQALEKRRYVQREKEYKVRLEEEVAAKTLELAEKNKLLKEYSDHLEASTVDIILTLQNAMEEKDIYTAGHTNRVTEYAILVAQEMGVTEEEQGILERAAQLHDIGKLVIDMSSIGKPGPLTSDEWIRIKTHPIVGENIIKHLGYLGREGEIVRYHHERFDGAGYPFRLKSSDLDILTRILTVADSYDAMTSKRCYRKNLSREEATAELYRCAGTHFDPDVVDVFASIIQNFQRNPALIN